MDKYYVTYTLSLGIDWFLKKLSHKTLTIKVKLQIPKYEPTSLLKSKGDVNVVYMEIPNEGSDGAIT